MSNFLGQVSCVLGGKNLFKNIVASALKSCIKLSLKKIFLILGKKIMIFKLELSPQNFHYDVLYPLYSGVRLMNDSGLGFTKSEFWDAEIRNLQYTIKL